MSETVTMTLTDFLLARIAEDEGAAQYEYVIIPQGAMAPRWHAGRTFFPGGGFLEMSRDQHDELLRAQFEHGTEVADPRMLAECESKRQIIEALTPHRHDSPAARMAVAACLAALALPYAEHPDYDESWRP